MLRTCVPAACVAASSLAVSAATASITIDLMPTSDADVQSSGVLGVSVEDNESNRTARSGGNNVRNSVYEFDLSSLPADAVITGASFNVTTRLIVSNVGSAAADVTFVTYAGDGVVTTADYQGNTAGNVAAIASDLVGTSAGTDVSIALDSLADLQAAVDGSGLLTLRSQTVNFVTFSVHSLETTFTGVTLPTLSITYIPAPATAALLLGGVLPMARRRRG